MVPQSGGDTILWWCKVRLLPRNYNSDMEFVCWLVLIAVLASPFLGGWGVYWCLFISIYDAPSEYFPFPFFFIFRLHMLGANRISKEGMKVL